MACEGADGLFRPEGCPVTTGQGVFPSSRAGTIYSGTTEIQRNIIGERALGLPKEPAPGRLTAVRGRPGRRHPPGGAGPAMHPFPPDSVL
jgi:hypothetical protein